MNTTVYKVGKRESTSYNYTAATLNAGFWKDYVGTNQIILTIINLWLTLILLHNPLDSED